MPTERTELITPKKAEELLKLNTRNRRIRPKKLMQYARAMKRGEWKPENPDPIIVNSHVLFNGQHRLAAVIESETPVRMKVQRGASSSLMATLDTGLSRTLADTLKLNGEQYAPILGSTLHQLWMWQEEGKLGGKANESPSHGELLEVLERTPEIREIVGWVGREVSKREVKGIGNPSLIAAAYWIFSKIDEGDANEFIRRLLTGTDLKANDPILALRRVMLESRQRPRPRVLGALIIKAWNAWRDGEPVQLLTWRGGGTSREAFPVPH